MLLFSIFVFLDEAATATSLKVFRILLIVGWIAACIAVVYVVLFMIRVHSRPSVWYWAFGQFFCDLWRLPVLKILQSVIIVFCVELSSFLYYLKVLLFMKWLIDTSKTKTVHWLVIFNLSQMGAAPVTPCHTSSLRSFPVMTVKPHIWILMY